MANYYFLITAFPTLSLGSKLEMSFKELQSYMQLNLTPTDLEKIEELLRPIDLYNIRALWLGLPLDDRGSIKAKELEEELLVQQALPEYVVEYLERYESTEERLRYFASLYASLYRETASHLSGFLAKYTRFEREFRLVLTALRAKAFKRDLVRELQFEDPTDPLVAEILAQKDAEDFTPPMEFELLKPLFQDNLQEPKKLNRAMLEYRFNRIEEMEQPEDFGIDRVLAYVAKFMIAESLASLDKEKGMEQLSQYE